MLKHDLGGLWQAWTDISLADEFYGQDFAAEPEYLLQIPGHWQTESELSEHKGSVLYRTTFEWQPTHTWPVSRLCIGGAFYHLSAWLNGQPLAEHDGYFEPISWELRPEQLQTGHNVLAIRVDCPPEGTSWRDIVIGIYGEWERKPASVNPGGIWGEVFIGETFRGYLQHLHVESRLTAWNSAQIRTKAEFVWRSIACRAKAVLHISPRNFTGKAVSQEYELSVQSGINQIDLKLSLPEPKLWWTWDQGHPHLYDVTLQLFDEQEDEVDILTSTLGIRELEWKDWQFILNGRRLFLRGANYGPTSFYPSTVSRETLKQDVKMLTEANLNFVRIYNHVALPEFYLLCAEAGLAVWQDFPLNKKYDRNITGVALRQIRTMVKLLRNEPAICFWSCHNEPFVTARNEKSSTGFLAKVKRVIASVRPGWNKDVLDPRLREAILQLDQSRPVMANSGVYGFLRGGSATHHYFGWDTTEYRSLTVLNRFFPRAVRLVNEYGAQSLPLDADFLAELATFGDWPTMDWAQIQAQYLGAIDKLHQHVPPADYKDLTSYALATQRYQAELLQFYHEFLRLQKYKSCAGAVLFYFADAVPQISCALLDASRQPKLAYYATQRAMRPLQVMINWPKKAYRPGDSWRSPIYIVNDLARPFSAMGLSWQLLDGEHVLIRERAVVDAEADAVTQSGELEIIVPEGFKGELKLEIELSLPTGERIENFYTIHVES